MTDIYFSKFNQSAWSCWNMENIPKDQLRIVERIDFLLKTSLPGKYLFFLELKDSIVLVAAREKIGMDESGRHFGFRHYRVIHPEDYDKTAGIKPLLQQFSDPIDFSRPDVLSAPPESHPLSIQNNVWKIFTHAWHCILNESKICIIHPAINEQAKDKQSIDELNFINFPYSADFIEAIAVLPADLLSGLSFVMNYENDLAASLEKTTNPVRIIYCGTESLVDSNYTGEKAIDVQKLEAHGYKVFNIEERVSTEQDLFSFFEGKYKRSEPYFTLFNSWCRSNIESSPKEKALVLQLLFQVSVNREPATIDLELVASVLSARAGKTTRQEVFRWYLDNISSEVFYQQFYRLHALAVKTECEPAFEEKVTASGNISSAELHQLLSNGQYKNLPPSLKKKLTGLLQNLEWNDLKLPFIRNILSGKEAHEHLRLQLNEIWFSLKKKPLEPSAEDIENLLYLHKLTNNTTAFRDLIAEKYEQTASLQWLDLAQEQNITIDKQLKTGNSMPGMVQSLKLLKKYESVINYKDSKEAIIKGISSEVENEHRVEILDEAYKELNSLKRNNGKISELYNTLGNKIRLSYHHALDLPPHTFDSSEHLFFNHDIDRRHAILKHLQENLQQQFSVQRFRNLLRYASLMNGFGPDLSIQLFNRFEPQLIRALDEGQHQLDLAGFVAHMKISKQIPAEIRHRLKGNGIWSKIKAIAPGIKPVYIIIPFTAILIALIYLLTPGTDDPQKNGNDVAGIPASSGAVNTPVDSTALMISESEKFLNSYFFPKTNDSLDFYKFRKKGDTIGIKFYFPGMSFKDYRIKSIDTAAAKNVWWSRLVESRKDSVAYLLQLVTDSAGKDSFKYVYRINISTYNHAGIQQ